MQDLKWIKVKSAAVFHVMQGSQLQCIKGSGLWSYVTQSERRWRNRASALFVNSSDAQDGGLALAGNFTGQCKVLLAHCKHVQNHVEQYCMVAGCWWSGKGLLVLRLLSGLVWQPIVAAGLWALTKNVPVHQASCGFMVVFLTDQPFS